MSRATAAKGSFPYPHRTVAQIDALDAVYCTSCCVVRTYSCTYSRCPVERLKKASA